MLENALAEEMHFSTKLGSAANPTHYLKITSCEHFCRSKLPIQVVSISAQAPDIRQ
jgi:hypothetical protein